MSYPPQTLYENEEFQLFTAGALRPGGLKLTGETVAAAALKKGAHVLDVGCGLGETVAFLAEQGFACAGVEPSLALLKKARKKYPKLELRQGEAEALPWENGSFDAVLCECSFSLFARQQEALAQLHRVLAEGGQLLLCDFYLPEKGKNGLLPNGSCLRGAKSQAGWQALMQSGGFTLRLWQDAADHLRNFTARMVWEYGSAEGFWRQMLPAACGGTSTEKNTEKTKEQVTKPAYACSIWERV